MLLFRLILVGGGIIESKFFSVKFSRSSNSSSRFVSGIVWKTVRKAFQFRFFFSRSYHDLNFCDNFTVLLFLFSSYFINSFYAILPILLNNFLKLLAIAWLNLPLHQGGCCWSNFLSDTSAKFFKIQPFFNKNGTK